MIHCVSTVPSELCVQWILLALLLVVCPTVCLSVCFFYEQIQDTLSERPQADGVDAYLRQTGLTLHTGCPVYTHTHRRIEKAPEERDFPALQHTKLGSRRRRWRREKRRVFKEEETGKEVREGIQWEEWKSREQKEIEVVESINNWLTSPLKPSINVHPQNTDTHARTHTGIKIFLCTILAKTHCHYQS